MGQQPMLYSFTCPCKFSWCHQQPDSCFWPLFDILLIWLWVATTCLSFQTLVYASPLKETLSCRVSVISYRIDWSLGKRQLPDHTTLSCPARNFVHLAVHSMYFVLIQEPLGYKMEAWESVLLADAVRFATLSPNLHTSVLTRNHYYWPLCARGIREHSLGLS